MLHDRIIVHPLKVDKRKTASLKSKHNLFDCLDKNSTKKVLTFCFIFDTIEVVENDAIKTSARKG